MLMSNPDKRSSRMPFEKLSSYAVLMRPVGWVPFLFPLVFGLIDSGTFSLNLGLAYLLVVIYGPLLLGSIYILNFYSDIEVDRITTIKKDVMMSKQPFVTGKIRPSEGLLFATLLLVSGLVLSFMINLQVFLLSLASAIVGILYSLPPRLKDLPFLDIVTNSFSAGFICYTSGWCASRSLVTIPVLPIAWLTSLIASTYLLTVIIDYEPDKKTGLRTTATILGVRRSAALSAIIYCISMISYASVATSDAKLHYLLPLPFLLLSPYGYYKVLKAPTPEKAYKLGKLAVEACVVVLLLLLLISPILLID